MAQRAADPAPDPPGTDQPRRPGMAHPPGGERLGRRPARGGSHRGAGRPAHRVRHRPVRDLRGGGLRAGIYWGLPFRGKALLLRGMQTQGQSAGFAHPWARQPRPPVHRRELRPARKGRTVNLCSQVGALAPAPCYRNEAMRLLLMVLDDHYHEPYSRTGIPPPKCEPGRRFGHGNSYRDQTGRRRHQAGDGADRCHLGIRDLDHRLGLAVRSTRRRAAGRRGRGR